MRLIKILSTTRDSMGRIAAKFLRNGKSDVQETLLLSPFGIDSNPVKDFVAAHSETGVMGESVVIGFINPKGQALPGEIRIYSTDENGSAQIYLWAKSDGTIHFGGQSGNLTRFQELEAGYNELRDDLNALISAYNLHVHPAPGGTASPTASTDTASTA